MRTTTRLILTAVAGFCDTATFVHMKGVFSAHVTGNFVLLAASLVDGGHASDLLKLETFPVFIAAIGLAVWLYLAAEKRRKGEGLRRILQAMTVIFAACTLIAFVPHVAEDGWDVAITLLVVLALGLQNALHHFIGGSMTTVMTGTVTTTIARAMRRLLRAELPEQPNAQAALSPIWLVLVFGAGCLGAAFAVKAIGFVCLIVPAVAVAASLYLEKPKP